MFEKYGFIFLILVFGLLMFGLGVVASPWLRGDAHPARDVPAMGRAATAGSADAANSPADRPGAAGPATGPPAAESGVDPETTDTGAGSKVSAAADATPPASSPATAAPKGSGASAGIPEVPGGGAAPPTAPDSATGVAKASDSAATATPPAAAAAAKPVPYESLTIPVPLPPKRRYALQAGMFVDPAAAGELAHAARALRVPVQTIAVVDGNGAVWTVLAVGDFDAPESARVQQRELASLLGIVRRLTPILLPAKKKAA